MSKWSIKGFDALSKGLFENGGQNLYVSRQGVLQRIWRFDVNNDGFVDLLIANSHDYNEHPNLYVISDPTGNAALQEVLTQGAQTAAVTDLNGDGFDDLVIASTHDGHHIDLPSYVYFGGRDGITENRKIDLGAPACMCCGTGDFDGDGKKEICYLIADGVDAASPTKLHNIRLRIYHQTALGFRIDGYREYPTEICYFTVADINGDGCDDLYCRTNEGKWLVLWGSPEGFSMERSAEIGAPTDDRKRFDLLPFGGGNVRYEEFARPKILKLQGKIHLFYADAHCVRLIPWAGGDEIVLPVPNVISAAVGRLSGCEDLVLLQADGLENQYALIYDGTSRLKQKLPVMTPRDVLLCDFSGNGHDDLVVVQGRSDHAHTSESLLFCTDSSGNLCPDPRRFTTHNCVEAFAVDFDGTGKKSLVFVNQQQSNAYGHIPVYVYLGSQEGFIPENRLEFPGHSAGTMLPVDFNDDGWPDLLVLHNAEDQPFLHPDGDLYWGGPEGFKLENKVQLETPYAWGGHCADLNRDGYLDVISCGGGTVRIFYGGPEGFSKENEVHLNVMGDELKGPAGVLWPALADLNGDGWLDLAVPISWQSCSRVYFGGPDGFSNERSILLPIENALTVRIADLDKDGYPDLIFGSRASYHRNVYHEGTVTIFWGGPDGYSGYNCCVLPSYQSNCITIADLNNDGWLDIFASSYFNKRERDINSFIYWNDHGNFSLTNRKRLFTHSSSAAWACDFNEDGYTDLCITNHRAYGSHRTDSAIWWNGPKGFTEENRTWLPTIGPHDMVPTDVGNVMTRSPEEYYITPAARVEDLHFISWEGTVPEKTWVNCQIRTAPTLEELKTASFIGEDGTAQSRLQRAQAIPGDLIHGPFLEIKLYLGAVNSGNSPRITEISVY